MKTKKGINLNNFKVKTGNNTQQNKQIFCVKIKKKN